MRARRRAAALVIAIVLATATGASAEQLNRVPHTRLGAGSVDTRLRPYASTVARPTADPEVCATEQTDGVPSFREVLVEPGAQTVRIVFRTERRPRVTAAVAAELDDAGSLGPSARERRPRLRFREAAGAWVARLRMSPGMEPKYVHVGARWRNANPCGKVSASWSFSLRST